MSDQAIEQRIRQHRLGAVQLALTTPGGKPVANTEISVRQTRHKFLFGCNIFPLHTHKDPEIEAAYQQRFTDLLNFVTVPFYWGGYEAEEGKTQRERLMSMTRWCIDHGLKVKGHTLCYHMSMPEWAYNLPFAKMRAKQFERITRDVADFAGCIDFWDVCNEVAWMPGHENGKHPIARLCRHLGRVGLVKETYGLAHAADPNAKLIINDCDPTPTYEHLVRESIAAGAPIDIVGIQSHMHLGYWGVEKAWKVCERFARYGKPLHFSELTILSGIIQPNHSWRETRTDWFSTPEGEEQQAEQVREFYRLLFSHPSVEGITWWNFSDDRAWLGAPAGFVRKDMSPKPAYDELLKLVKGEWWTKEQRLCTDAQGKVTVEGFLGDYALDVAGTHNTFAISTAGAATAPVALTV